MSRLVDMSKPTRQQIEAAKAARFAASYVRPVLAVEPTEGAKAEAARVDALVKADPAYDRTEGSYGRVARGIIGYDVRELLDAAQGIVWTHDRADVGPMQRYAPAEVPAALARLTAHAPA